MARILASSLVLPTRRPVSVSVPADSLFQPLPSVCQFALWQPGLVRAAPRFAKNDYILARNGWVRQEVGKMVYPGACVVLVALACPREKEERERGDVLTPPIGWWRLRPLGWDADSGWARLWVAESTPKSLDLVRSQSRLGWRGFHRRFCYWHASSPFLKLYIDGLSPSLSKICRSCKAPLSCRRQRDYSRLVVSCANCRVTQSHAIAEKCVKCWEVSCSSGVKLFRPRGGMHLHLWGKFWEQAAQEIGAVFGN